MGKTNDRKVLKKMLTQTGQKIDVYDICTKVKGAMKIKERDISLDDTGVTFRFDPAGKLLSVRNHYQ